MGEMIDFAAAGQQARGYLGIPESGSGPGVMVIQEWWGLVPQIKRICDSLAEAGFVALAPDLYRGELAQHDEMDKANHLMTSLDQQRAANDMSGAITALLDLEAVTSTSVGVVGYCMGGMLALVIAANEGDRVGCVAPFYGAPLGDDGPDFNGLTAKVAGHFAEKDDFFPPEAVKGLEKKLIEMGKDVSFTVHPGTGHAFTNEDNPLGTYDAQLSATTWQTTVDLFKSELS